MAVETTWKSAPGPSDVAAYKSRKTAFQQGSTFLSPGYYDPTAEGTFELQSKLYSDPAAYARYINTWVTGWRNNTAGVPNSNFKNELDYIQFLARASGLSSEKDGVSRGILTEKDINGIKTASNIALANGISFKDVMLSIYESRQAAGVSANAPKYSKQIATSLRLIDLGDAQNKLSNSYYAMFGVYPSEANIKAFKKYWNQEVRKQEAETITSQVTQGGQPVSVGKQKGAGVSTKSKTVTKGEGFTEAEQAQVLATFLGSDITGVTDPQGVVKAIYDGIRKTYRDNFLPEPEFQSVANIVKDLASTADEQTYNTKLSQYMQKVRDNAAKFYPSLAEDLKNGVDALETGDLYYGYLAREWNTPVELLKRNKEANALVQNALAFRDEKGNSRLMDPKEFSRTARQSVSYLDSPQFIASMGRLGDKINSIMGGGR